MFRVFARFNALLVRPKIRGELTPNQGLLVARAGCLFRASLPIRTGAIQEYQTKLLERVKQSIDKLHDKFKRGYASSEAYRMSALRDQPPVAGAINWAKQIERQLAAYLQRVEDVLGKGWEHYAEGQQLDNESKAFRRKLDTKAIYEGWLHDINRRDMKVTGRIFDITKSRSASGTALQLSVNFDTQIITLFKEVRNLQWLGFQVPHIVSNLAKDGKRVYPHAVCLSEAVRTYTQTLAKVNANPGVAVLLAQYRQDVQDKIKEGELSLFASSAPLRRRRTRLLTYSAPRAGLEIRWDHFVNMFDSRSALSSLSSTRGVSASARDKHAHYAEEFAADVNNFHAHTETAIELHNETLRIIDLLATCPYTVEAFSKLLGQLQDTIDRLDEFSNLDLWTEELNKKVETILSERLRRVVDRWCDEFAKDGEAAAREATGTLRKKTTRESEVRRSALSLGVASEHEELTFFSCS